MAKDRMEWSQEVDRAANELGDAGVPGIGLIGKFAQTFYDKWLVRRFESFRGQAQIDEAFIRKVAENEEYSNCLYASLETIRRTHSRLGVSVIARLYSLYWDTPKVLVPALRAFAEISDEVVIAFVQLYRQIGTESPYLELRVRDSGEEYFHDLYEAAVELIGRNIFVLTTSSVIAANAPIQGMKGDNTEVYYLACAAAVENG